MSKEKKNNKEKTDPVLKEALNLLTNIYRRPTEPGVRTKVLDFLLGLDMDPRDTGI